MYRGERDEENGTSFVAGDGRSWPESPSEGCWVVAAVQESERQLVGGGERREEGKKNKKKKFFLKSPVL